jgi:hypothetical protein
MLHDPVYRHADKSRPVSYTVSAWEWVYATNLSRLQRETIKRHVGEAHSVLTAAILLPQRLSCYWGKIVSLRMLADLRLSIAQQRTTGQYLPSGLYRYRQKRVTEYQTYREVLGISQSTIIPSFQASSQGHFPDLSWNRARAHSINLFCIVLLNL